MHVHLHIYIYTHTYTHGIYITLLHACRWVTRVGLCKRQGSMPLPFSNKRPEG